MAGLQYWNVPKELKENHMTVPEMRKMLGLSKSESYWLLHKKEFRSYSVGDNYWIDSVSFEEWYANQTRYSKVEGQPPGEELKKRAYTYADIGDMLGLSEERAYEIMKLDNVETFKIGLRDYIPKAAFERWHHAQTKYRTAEDKERDREAEERSIWLPDVARMLGVDRQTVYSLVKNKKTKDNFEVITVAGRKRVTKQSFNQWYLGQTEYKILSDDEQKKNETEREENIESKRLRKLGRHADASKNACIYTLREPANPDFYSVAEVVEFYGYSRNTILKWIKNGIVPAIKVGKAYRLPREDFDDWLDMLSM